ncbi:MAG TPA: hypothetical protein PKC29_13750 [Thermodesulfobacteriota bacterium]|nr:hypothetical protein [Thermodesulfobacteriota bacterium]
MKHSPIAAIAILTLAILAPSCSRDKTPDIRDARWGMSKAEVKKAEKAELMKEGENILTYRIGGEPDKTEGTFTVTVDQNGETRDALVTIETIRNEPSWDLVYVFEDGKLATAAIHLRDTFDDPADYVSLMREKSLAISKELDTPAAGVAEYGDNPRKDDPYSAPEEICEGKYSLRHVWPTVRDRTDISIELDAKKNVTTPDCNLSVFYESVKYPVEPALSQDLHDLL